MGAPWKAGRVREREAKVRERGITLVFDLAGALLAAVAAVWAWVSASGGASPWHLGAAAACVVVWVACLSSSRTLKGRMRRSVLDDLPEIVRHVLVGAMAVEVAALPFAGVGSEGLGVAGFVASLTLIGVLCLPVARGGCYWVLNHVGRRAKKKVIVVGAGRVGRRVASLMGKNPRLRAEVVGFVDREPLGETVELGDACAASEGRYPVLGGIEDLGRLVARGGVDEVVVAFSRAPHEEFLELIWECDRHGVNISFVPRLYETTTVQSSVEDIGGIPLMHLNRVRLKGANAALKRAFDLVLTSCGLLLLWPVLVLLAVAVKLDSPGPVLFSQERVGPGGKKFRMHKFRSMRADAEAHGSWTRRADPRRTRLGRIMRPLNLDELPQLVNVLMGDLSLVGPRPEQPRYVEGFSSSVYRYADRHRIRGGITGWAQVHGLRGDTSIEERVLFDNYYIENWSMWLDVKILILTFCKAGFSAAEKAAGSSGARGSADGEAVA